MRHLSDSLTRYIGDLKQQMVRQADGKKGDVNRIRHKDDLEAASVVMLSPLRGEGKKLRGAIDNYRDQLMNWVEEPSRSNLIARYLSTETPSGGRSWEASLFEQMPLAAAVTLLTKIENDIRLSEGEALTSLLQSIDAGDYRLNRLNAWLIPEAETVLQGEPTEPVWYWRQKTQRGVPASWQESRWRREMMASSRWQHLAAAPSGGGICRTDRQ